MKINKLIYIFLMSAITLVMSACVPKATENKAVCGTNQAFDSVTRACVSTATIIYPPVANLSSVSLSQEVSKTITLSYSDANSNSAIMCNVNTISSNIEAMSPQVINHGIFNKADLVSASAENTGLVAIPLVAPATATSITNAIAAMKLALTTAKQTFTYSNIKTQLGLFETAVNTILAITQPIVALNPGVKLFYNLTNTNLLLYSPLKKFLDNNCDCTGGICTTVIAPRILQNGNAGFTYTVSDINGDSNQKVVSLSIAATSRSTNYLGPVVESDYPLPKIENSTNAIKAETFTLPAAHDLFGTASFSYSFNGVISGGYGITSHGRVSNCMGLTGSASTARNCVYTPTSGDLYDTVTPAKASVVIGGLTFTALKEGTFANNYTVQYFDLKNNNAGIDSFVTTTESFGLVSQSYPDIFLRVVGNNIKVFFVNGITSTLDIQNIINNDPKAKYLVSVSGGNPATFPDPVASTASAVSLAGGTDAFDTIGYTVSNGFASSTNNATVMLKMSHTDHAPLVPTEFNAAYTPQILPAATTVAMAEGAIVGQTITLPYFDVDNTPIVNAVSCTTDFLTLPNIGLSLAALPSPCSCVAGVCSVTVLPTAFFNGTGKFSYTITTLDQFTLAPKTSGSQSVSVSIWEVNNPPVLSLVSATTTAAGVPTVNNPIPSPLSMQENSTAAPSSAYICFTANAGGGTDEASQILTLTPLQVVPTSSVNLVMSFGAILIPAAVGNLCAVGQYMLPFTTTKNQSGTTNIKITLADNGTTHGVADPKSVNIVVPVLVNSVDDPPYFIQAITSVQTNEGGAVVAGPFTVDEDQGSSPDEDIQGIKIANITSDNTNVLPVSAISVFYDLNDNGVADTAPVDESRNFGSSSTVLPGGGIQTLEVVAADDVKAHSFYLKLSPIAGVSGNTNITITINDGNPALDHFVSKSFSLIINPVAALHGGWSNISAVGIKTDKAGAPASSNDFVCNYNKAADLNKCDTVFASPSTSTSTDCTGTTPPNSVVTPSAVNVLYWDSGSKRCYRSQGANDKFSWIEMRTSCPITRVTGDATAVCGGQNCIYDSTLLPAQTDLSTPGQAKASGQYYFKTSANACYLSTQPTPGTFAWTTPFVPSKITLSWNSFIMAGSGVDSTVQIEGWNIYRREAGYDYDFKNGFLKINSADTKTISDSTSRTFTDNTAIAGKIYYYLVRPVDSNHHLATFTPEVFSELRIFAPKENYAFVHRWMVNQEICNSMHMTTSTTNKVDPTHDYRCPYKGPGESTLNPGYYDIEKDMLVDISEAGCPYTPAPACTSNGCIGIGDPRVGALGLSAAINSVYYDRSSGVCYINNNSGTGWDPYHLAPLAQVTAASTKGNTALNPPLVMLTQARADLVCSVRDVVSASGSLVGVATARLPEKKEFIAYGAAPLGMSDSVLTDMEQGFSLNVQSRCNSSGANGLETAYTDSAIPSTSFIYSLPGTASSGIRSLYTGSVPWVNSYSTEACSSRYGVQDIYGNVSQWVKDKMTCAGGGSFICTTNTGTSLGDYDFLTGSYAGGGNHYAFDFLTGPYNDVSGDNSTAGADGFLTQWTFRDELFGAGKFSFPVGMPINIDIATAPLNTGVLASSPTLPFLLDIGPTAGITSSQLHEDGIIVMGARIADTANNPTHVGSFVQGGSYNSGNLSGRYSSELVPDTQIAPDIGFRCFIPISTGNYPADPGRHTYSY